jgi:hypothetical protein
MLRLNFPRRWRLGPFRAAVNPSPIRAAAEWGFFLTCLVLIAATIWWRIRTTGPAVLAIGVLGGWMLGLADRRDVLRRLAVLLFALVAAYVLRNHTYSLLAQRGGRLVLVSGLTLTALLSLPAPLLAALARLNAVLARKPNGRTAIAVAVWGVVCPVAVLQTNTTDKDWTGDTMPVVPTVVQLWEHGNRDLTGYLPGNGYFRWDVCGPGRPYFVRDVPGAEGVYSTYPAGMEVFAWPGVLAADAIGLDLSHDVVLFWIEKLCAALLTGLCLGLFFLTALHVGSPGAAFTATWLLATGSVFSSTIGLLLWQQGGIVFWSLLALWIELRSGGRPGWCGILLQGIACGMMLACRPSAVTFLVPFGLWVLARDWRRGIIMPLIAIAAFLPWAALYYALYRNPFGPAMGFLNEQWFPGENVVSVLLSPGRGLFVYQPWMLLLGLLVLRSARTGDRPLPPGWSVFATTMMTAHIFLVGSWPMWWGGFCYGSRLAAEVVPIAGLLVVRPLGWLFQLRGGWIVVVIVALIGFAVHAPCVYYDAWLWNALPISADAHPERLWDWSRPPFMHGMLPPN